MYLKSIEVQGFKSFANKILFEFHNGITGIVGPNGSGKSNVADAVRWVLGEQRAKQLRGGSMQDVIFSGTENRRPLSYASVAITLDNADHQLPVDYHEVTVTRKLYRSGESEYLINGTACRLKDVNELFYDTGIGKEGYSIIGQGQIDKILSGKPEERRELFDEAAGIVKFKRRKYLSVRKLEDERQNLVRVNDILSELEKQVEPLRRQSETARIYLKKKEELKIYDINMFLMDTIRLKEQMETAQRSFDDANRELTEAKEKQEALKHAYEKQEQKLVEAELQMDGCRTKRDEKTLAKQQAESQIQVLEEQIRTAKMSDSHYDQRLLAIAKELKEYQEQKAAFAKEQEQLGEKISGAKIEERQAEENLKEIQTQIAELLVAVEKKKNDTMQLLENRASTKAKLQHYDTMMEQTKVQRAQMNQRLIEMKSNSGEQEAQLKKYEEDFLAVQAEIEKHQAESNRLEDEIEQLQKQLKDQNEQLQIGQTTFHREKSRLESLRNLTERYDGYGGSIRKIMERKEEEKGLLGVVADLIKVDKTYEIAIETALGGNIQNIVTDCEETAKRMIDFLKRNKYGRATFLPLTAINGTSGIRQPEALQEKGVIGLASTLVAAEPKYQKLIDHLLGRTVVVHTIEDGIALARKYRQSLRIVTLEGELMNPGGSMTGGSFKNTSNLLSRRREIEEYEKAVRRLYQEMQQMQSAVIRDKEKRTACYADLEKNREILQNLYVKQNTVKMNLAQAKERQGETSQAFTDIHQEGMRLERQMAEIFENKESIQMELETSELLEKEFQRRIQQLQKEVEQKKEKEAIYLKSAEAAHLESAALDQKNLFLQENVKRMEEEMFRRSHEEETLQAGKEHAANEIAEREGQILKLRQTIVQLSEELHAAKEELASYMEQKEKLQLVQKEIFQSREDLSRHLSDLDKETFRLDSKKTALEEQTEKLMDYMWEEYELTYSHALEMRKEELLDPVLLKKEIQRLKTEIKALGTVNVNAIEDYKNVLERYEFLKGQHDDLVEAEKTLVQIIEELDIAMRKQFEEQFAKIAKEFDSVFKQLFGGGKGTLELLEDEDILEAGIRIIAQPPGKKLQNMMQLSGGEKALTAIALLFAIQNLKPSPFCLLDEIEAALDDSNVTRFAKYLHKLTKHTQFIVITHRRGTMTAADRLYGITMQEKGVSTLVSVNLLEDELEK